MSERSSIIPPSRAITQPAQQVLRLPRATGAFAAAPVFNAAMQQLEAADAGNVKKGQPPTFHAIALMANDGSAWLVTVSTSGVLQTVAIDRT